MGISPARILNGTTQRVAVNVSASGDNPIVAAVPGRAIVVTNFYLSGAAAVNGKFRSGTTDLMGAVALGSPFGGIFNPAGHVETNVGEALNLNLSSGVAVTGFVNYTTYQP